MLLTSWSSLPFRSTQDLDLARKRPASLEKIRSDFEEICSQNQYSEEDGLVYVQGGLKVDSIQTTNRYAGFRVRFKWHLGRVVVANKIDIGVGDTVKPAPVEMDFPAILDMPTARINAYPRETVVAEKFEAVVAIGLANSRMKDFYDLWVLARNFDFEGIQLEEAVVATFANRETPLPTAIPDGLTDRFALDETRKQLWMAFIQRVRTPGAEDVSLLEVVHLLRQFLLPVANQVVGKQRWRRDGWYAI